MLATRRGVSRLATAAAVPVVGIATAIVVVVEASHGSRDLVLFLAGAAMVALGVASARASIALTVATFMFWSLVRRLLPASAPTVDPAAIVPFLVALPLGLRGLRVRKPPAVLFLVAWASFTAVVSLRPLVGLAGWLNFVLPLLAAFAVTAIPTGTAVLVRWTVVCGAAAATYGIAQYLVPFRWDAQWLANVNFVSVGGFGKATFRPFATLPAPGTAAVVSAIVILLVVFKRDEFDPSPLVRAWALSASTLFLLLVQVRTAWIACICALLVGLLSQRGQSAMRVLACIAVAVAALSMAPQSTVVARRAQTFTHLASDDSFRGRIAFIKAAPRLLTPFGTGLGTRSSASRVEADQSIDAGYLVVLAEMGLVGLGLLLWVLADTARRTTAGGLPFLALLVVCSMAAMVFGGLVGLVLWATVWDAATTRPPRRYRADRDEETATITLQE
ncbi:MAG TPA: hypothetical protein VFJ85_16460 [Acidimicrobiales bacterium]|nr:hypothetical protein [Acidimicrobiales bacterium]